MPGRSRGILTAHKGGKKPPPTKQVAEELAELMAALRTALLEDQDVYTDLTHLLVKALDSDLAKFKSNKTFKFDDVWTQLWCNLFALLIDRPNIGNLLPLELVLTLRQMSLIDRLTANRDDDLPEEGQAKVIEAALAATPILPNALFPSASPGDPPLIPVAIGRLNRLQLRPLAYRLGEIASIDNVMKGATGSRAHKRIMDQRVDTDDETDLRDATLTSLSETESDGSTHRTWTKPGYTKAETFDKSGLSSTIVFTPYDKSNGNNNSSGSGEKSDSNKPKADHNEVKQVARFVRDLTKRSRERLRNQRRHISRNRERTREETDESQVIDNLAGSDHLVGIYRWVDKVYQAALCADGDYLLLQMDLASPARSLLIEMMTNAGLSAKSVVAPGLLNPPIDSPTKIDEKNIADLQALYDISEMPSPPAATIRLTAAFDGRLDTGNQILDIPDGYKAASAYVSFAPKDLTVEGYIGQNQVDAPSPGAEIKLDASPGPLDCFFQFQPANTQTGATSINLTVVCERQAALFSGWQIDAYDRVIAGYETQDRRYGDAIKSTLEAQPLLGQDDGRDTQLQVLKAAVLRRLLGPAPDFDNLTDQQIRAQQLQEQQLVAFYEQALLWSKMVWANYPSLWPSPAEGGPNTALLREVFAASPAFADFLTAGSARLILPVAPGYENLILLSLALGGRIWVDGNLSAPVAESDLPLANALKLSATGVGGTSHPLEEWTEIVPTGLSTLLDRDDQLPPLVATP